MVTHLEPDILECEVKWALGSIITYKASRADGIPVELFKILKVMLLKCCTQYTSKLRKLSGGQDWKKSVFIPIPKKGSAIALIFHASKVMLKILQVTL